MHLVLQGCQLTHFKLMVCKVLENLEEGIPAMQSILCYLY